MLLHVRFIVNKERKYLQSMVKQGASDTQWPKYEVEIRGRAKSYEDAEVGIEKLKTKEYAYSTDDEIACQKKMLQEKKFYQMKKSSIDASIIKESLNNFHVDLRAEGEDVTENIHDQGLDKNSTKNLLYDGKYEKKRNCPSQRSERNEMSFQHSLPFDDSYDSDDSSHKSIESTTQHKIKTARKRSKHLSSHKHSSKSRRVSRSSSIEHLSSPDKNGTEKGNKNSCVIELKRKSEKNEKPNERERERDGKHSYSLLYDINKNNTNRSFMNSSRRIYNKFSDSCQPSNSYQTNDKENMDGNHSPFSNKQYMKTQNLKNVQPNMNSRKSSSQSLNCNETSVRDSMSLSNSPDLYSFGGRLSRGNERNNISKKSHEIGSESSRGKSRITVTSQSAEETYSRSFQSSQRDSHLCTIDETEATEHELSSLKEIVLKCHGSVSKQISDLKGLVIDCINKIKKLQTKMENAPLQAMEALDLVDDEDSQPIQLPCATMNDFEEFNDLIRLNTEYRNKIKMKIFKSVNKRRPMTRCLGDIIRQFVSANVGKLLVPVKATPGKKVFKNMTIYSLIEGIYTHSFGSKNKPVSTQKFIKAVQGVLHNTKDWNGGRKIKETNEKSEEENANESNNDFQESEED